MNPMKLLSILLIFFHSALALTPAGTLIRNQASASFQGETYLSNEVGTKVRALCVPQLGPNGSVAKPGQQVTSRQGEFIYLSYLMQNVGNASFDFRLGWAQDVSSSWTPETVRFFADTNANGQLDEAEPVLKSLNLARNKSQPLIMELKLPPDALGQSYITPTLQCSTGELDSDNYALIRVTQGPALQLIKSVSQQTAKPGESLEFGLQLVNKGGSSASGEVILTDLFDTPELMGLRFETGSAKASTGKLEYFDGLNWQETEPESVKGIRLIITDLTVEEVAQLGYKMQVLATAQAGKRRNSALAEGPGGPAEAAVEFELIAHYEHHLGPINNARALPGGEESLNDSQSIDKLIFGQSRCFLHTLENASTSQDSYQLHLLGLPPQVSASFNTMQDLPLAESIALDAGETLDFKLCLTTSGIAGGFNLTLEAISETTEEANLTFDKVESSVSASQISLIKTASKPFAVDTGEDLSYTLSIKNGNSFELHNLVISDQLQEFKSQSGKPVEIQTAFVSASDGGVFDTENRLILWQLDSLKAGESLELQLTVRMPKSPPKGEVFSLANYFTLEATELINPLKSNTVFNGFPVINIAIEKTVEPAVIKVGETLHYSITVSNPNNVPMAIELSDLPDSRLAYVDGSSLLKLGATQKALEPLKEGKNLIWNLRNEEGFLLQAAGDLQGQDKLTVSYEMVPKPGASGELKNIAQVIGQYTFASSGDETSNPVSGISVTSLEVEALVEVQERTLAERSALLAGRVFFDYNGNNLYDYGLDLALPGARLLLSNGWQTLTDLEGRYSFRDLAPGTWSVMLDSSSAPFVPLAHPESLDDGYRHRIVVEGLSVSDFVLELPLGMISASRETSLIFGPLRIDKSLIELGEFSRVVLHLSSSEALPELSLSDTVPGQEAKLFYFELFQGETTLTYDIPKDLPLTDPNVRWRYP